MVRKREKRREEKRRNLYEFVAVLHVMDDDYYYTSRSWTSRFIVIVLIRIALPKPPKKAESSLPRWPPARLSV